MGSTYVNKDGLVQRYGSDSAQSPNVAEVRNSGDRRWLEIDVDWRKLPAFSASTLTRASYGEVIPAGALIEDVEIKVDEAFTSGGAATLDVGFIDADAETGDDIDAFIAAASITELTALGITYRGTSPADGSAINTRTSATKVVTFHVGTATYTAGRATVRVFYSVQDKTADTLGT